MIKRTFHASLDYLSALILMGAPWGFHFSDSVAASAVAVAAGTLILIMSLLTNYEGGLIHRIPMAVHLNIDVLLGILLAVSPWVLGFEKRIYLPHLLMGILAILAGLLTVRRSLEK